MPSSHCVEHCSTRPPCLISAHANVAIASGPLRVEKEQAEGPSEAKRITRGTSSGPARTSCHRATSDEGACIAVCVREHATCYIGPISNLIAWWRLLGGRSAIGRYGVGMHLEDQCWSSTASKCGGVPILRAVRGYGHEYIRRWCGVLLPRQGPAISLRCSTVILLYTLMRAYRGGHHNSHHPGQSVCRNEATRPLHHREGRSAGGMMARTASRIRASHPYRAHAIGDEHTGPVVATVWALIGGAVPTGLSCRARRGPYRVPLACRRCLRTPYQLQPSVRDLQKTAECQIGRMIEPCVYNLSVERSKIFTVTKVKSRRDPRAGMRQPRSVLAESHRVAALDWAVRTAQLGRPVAVCQSYLFLIVCF